MFLSLDDDRTRTLLKRAALTAWLLLVGWIVFRQAREMDWPQVVQALRSFDGAAIAGAFLLGLPAFAACASFDLVGRHATGHDLPVRRVMAISWTGYFFSLNLGALIGGLAFRYRLYMPYGLPGMTISQVIGLSIVTNWSGYVPIAGGILAWQPPDLPPQWGVSDTVMRGTGILLLAVSLAYFALCAFKGGSKLRWRGSDIELPNLRIAALQVALSGASWGGTGAIITWLLPGDISWFTVMPVLMISAIAGIWSHVPSGLGVIELVFIGMLGHRAPDTQVLAAILVFRLVYYLVPFALALVTYAWLEATAKKRR